jgi:hypothetical protein
MLHGNAQIGERACVPRGCHGGVTLGNQQPGRGQTDSGVSADEKVAAWHAGIWAAIHRRQGRAGRIFF